MGIFGSIGKWANTADATSGLTGADKLNMLGASLTDAGDPTGKSNQLGELQKLMAEAGDKRKKAAAVQAFASAFGPQYENGPAPQIAASQTPASLPSIGALRPQQPAPTPGYTYQPPTKIPGLTLNDPRTMPTILSALNSGVPGATVTNVLELMKAQRPDMKFAPNGEAVNGYDPGNLGRIFPNRANVNNTIVDLNDPTNTNRVVPSEPVKGAMPTYDNLGHVIDWTLPQGAADAMRGASQANQTGQTMGTVFNRPNGDGSTTPTLGRDMFSPQSRAAMAGADAGGQGGAGGPGRTLMPGEIEAQKVDYTAGAGTIAGAGDAKIKAANSARQYQQAVDDALALDTNDLTSFKLGTAKILRSLGVQNPDLEKFTNTADGYRMLTTQMVLPLAKELGSNPSNRDAKIIQDSMPGLRTPRQTAVTMFSQQAALQNKEAARQDFFANYAGPQSKSAMTRAWNQSPEAKRSIFQDPVWQKLQIDGHPAVVYKQKGGKTYGIYLPYAADGKPNPRAQVFEAQ